MFTRFQRCQFIFFSLKNYSNSSTLEVFIKKKSLNMDAQMLFKQFLNLLKTKQVYYTSLRWFLLIQYHNYLLIPVRKNWEPVIRWIKPSRGWTLDQCLRFRLTVQQWMSISRVLCVYVTYWPRHWNKHHQTCTLMVFTFISKFQSQCPFWYNLF